MTKRLGYCLTLGALAAMGYVAGTGQALAQSGIDVPTRDTDIGIGETVTSRARPETDALGARVGSFVVLPKLRVDEVFNDNIFAAETGAQSDFITVIAPSLSVQSDWGNHQLRLDGSGNIGQHADNSRENYEDYRFGASGRVDVTRQTKVRARAGYRVGHEERSSPDIGAALDPTVFDVISANLEGSHRFNRVTLALGGIFDQYSFDNNVTGTGVFINNKDRDRRQTEGYLRASYEIAPQYSAFVRGSYNVRDYDSAVDDNGLNRDSDGYAVVAGASIDFGGITFGDFYAGYLTQMYDDPSLKTASGPVFGADLTWNVTRLTTVTGTVSTSVRETTAREVATGRQASGRLFTTAGVAVDHELTRSVLIGANVSASLDDFKGISREDKIYRAGATAKYLINRYANVGGEYHFRMRSSNVATAEFNENVFLLRLQVQY